MNQTIAGHVPRDRDLPELDVLRRVLDGTLYDVLPYRFHEEKNGAGEYVPLRDRRHRCAPDCASPSWRIPSPWRLLTVGPATDCEDRPTPGGGCLPRSRRSAFYHPRAG